MQVFNLSVRFALLMSAKSFNILIEGASHSAFDSFDSKYLSEFNGLVFMFVFSNKLDGKF